MISRYLKKKRLKNKDKVMKKLEEQRGKYDDTFTLWNAKMAELEEKQEEKAIAYRQNKKKDPNSSRNPNKTDIYDKI